MELFSAIASERRFLADMLEQLTPDQQEAHSLCSEWTVKQVAAHLVMRQADGATHAGVSRPTVARIEAGQDVSTHSLAKVAGKLGLALLMTAKS